MVSNNLSINIETGDSMGYALVIGVLYGALFAQSALWVPGAPAAASGVAGGVLIFLSLVVPGRFLRYSLQDAAPTVLGRLVRRAVVGCGFVLAAAIVALALAWGNYTPTFVGEIYVWTLTGVVLFQIIGEVMAPHVIYLQHTHQYNSNQLFVALIGIGMLVFTLSLYFLAFDLAGAPDMHRYLRDLLAITLVLIGYGHALYRMAHH